MSSSKFGLVKWSKGSTTMMSSCTCRNTHKAGIGVALALGWVAGCAATTGNLVVNAVETVIPQIVTPEVTDPSAPEQPTRDLTAPITLEEMVASNTAEAVFAVYDSVRLETDFMRQEMGVLDGHETQVIVNGPNGITLLSSLDNGWQLYVENGNVYRYHPDESPMISAFFDDGAFDDYYGQFMGEYLTIYILPTEVIIGEEIEGDIRTVTTVVPFRDSPDGPYFAETEFVDGTVTTFTQLDMSSNFVTKIVGYWHPDAELDMAEAISVGSSEIFYGQDDDWQVPAWVASARDMTNPRTVTFIKDADTDTPEVVSVTAGAAVRIVPEPFGEYAYFLDDAFTQEWNPWSEAPLGDATVYMIRG
ncbi:MAG: hypothetical protein FWG25_06785 [Promicromonosporaceae bacterium]|nr:hypothetical protein [Promicromonosporaceae bacterium]